VGSSNYYYYYYYYYYSTSTTSSSSHPGYDTKLEAKLHFFSMNTTRGAAGPPPLLERRI